MRRPFAILLIVCLFAPSALHAADTEIVAPPPITRNDHVRGRRNAAITMIVYSDFECPFCATHNETTRKLLRAYRGKTNLIFRHFPLPFHASAEPAARAAECVAKIRGTAAFWSFVDAIFAQGASRYSQIGIDVSGDASRFQSCMDSSATTSLIESQAQGAANVGVNGTPSTYLIDRRDKTIVQMVGAQPLEAFRATIDEMLR